MSDINTLKESADEIALNNTAGVYKLIKDNTTYWVKVCGENKSNFVRYISSLIAKVESLSFLKTNALLTPEDRFEHEKLIISHLKEKGFPVPNIIDENDDYFITLDAGTPFEQVDPSLINEQLIEQLLLIFSVLHTNNIAHGRPALRDILVNDENEVQLIDFEEATLKANSKLKARDIFLLLMDLHRIESISQSAIISALFLWKGKVDDQDWQALISMGNRLQKLAFVGRLILKFKPRNKTSIQILKVLEILKIAQAQCTTEG
ncbi:hypothetical protein M9194_00885 [Vibrio sp. S4M6]|uniref:lipopolysaccharide kinase InaA family protein n=1 Tax=Vibrio sinus TaxID=2946865 RepID=UPI00202A8B9F|nr:lipopolysaccharide kinase InaA family protein [Vibrio sinus]MCL9779983.1 hypothetical protein [Vibrio sinus]